MSTQKITMNIADGWVVVDNTGSPAIIQNGTSAPIKVTFQSTAPDGNSAFHTIEGGEFIERLGTETVYASTDYDGAAVIITV